MATVVVPGELDGTGLSVGPSAERNHEQAKRLGPQGVACPACRLLAATLPRCDSTLKRSPGGLAWHRHRPLPTPGRTADVRRGNATPDATVKPRVVARSPDLPCVLLLSSTCPRRSSTTGRRTASNDARTFEVEQLANVGLTVQVAHCNEAWAAMPAEHSFTVLPPGEGRSSAAPPPTVALIRPRRAIEGAKRCVVSTCCKRWPW
jgi:hypothetical protein